MTHFDDTLVFHLNTPWDYDQLRVWNRMCPVGICCFNTRPHPDVEADIAQCAPKILIVKRPSHWELPDRLDRCNVYSDLLTDSSAGLGRYVLIFLVFLIFIVQHGWCMPGIKVTQWLNWLNAYQEGNHLHGRHIRYYLGILSCLFWTNPATQHLSHSATSYIFKHLIHQTSQGGHLQLWRTNKSGCLGEYILLRVYRCRGYVSGDSVDIIDGHCLGSTVERSVGRYHVYNTHYMYQMLGI